MDTIIDRRNSGKKSSAGNRQRFLKKYKNQIKKQVNSSGHKRSIKDLDKNGQDITITGDGTSEPTFAEDQTRGSRKRVLTGNDTLNRGDRVKNPPQDNGKGSAGSDSDNTFDEYTFTLTKEEFIDLYFSDLELPDFIKETIKGDSKTKWQRAGYTKTGVPSRIDLKKTLKQSIARRKATGSTLFITDVDLRYKLFVKTPYPVKEAVVFMLMDVSGSMDEKLKEMAKKFFILLYLFLNKNYDNITIRFIAHTTTAKEVTEEEFFYGTETGGTIASSGLILINELIDKEIDLGKTNVYLAQASDGDNYPNDNETTIEEVHKLLKKVQYFTYIQFGESERSSYYKTLIDTYNQVSAPNFKATEVEYASEIYSALRELFGG